MNPMEEAGKSGWARWGRDAVLLAVFAAVIAWSLFFTVVRPGAGPSAAPAGAAAAYQGEVTLRARMLEAAWGNVRVGDRMGDSAVVTKLRVREARPSNELLVTIKVTGPLEFTTERYPFPQRGMPLRVGSVVWFETGRYTLAGDVVAMNP